MQRESTAERKYALTRVAAGDYMFPSNDAKRIWRVARYVDGPTYGVDLPRDREFWGVWSLRGHAGEFVDTEDWDQWEMQASGFETRRTAIAEALRLGGPECSCRDDHASWCQFFEQPA